MRNYREITRRTPMMLWAGAGKSQAGSMEVIGESMRDEIKLNLGFSMKLGDTFNTIIDENEVSV